MKKENNLNLDKFITTSSSPAINMAILSLVNARNIDNLSDKYSISHNGNECQVVYAKKNNKANSKVYYGETDYENEGIYTTTLLFKDITLFYRPLAYIKALLLIISKINPETPLNAKIAVGEINDLYKPKKANVAARLFMNATKKLETIYFYDCGEYKQLFTNVHRKDNVITVELGNIDWTKICTFPMLLPKEAFKLDEKAFMLTYYTYYKTRMNPNETKISAKVIKNLFAINTNSPRLDTLIKNIESACKEINESELLRIRLNFSSYYNRFAEFMELGTVHIQLEKKLRNYLLTKKNKNKVI